MIHCHRTTVDVFVSPGDEPWVVAEIGRAVTAVTGDCVLAVADAPDDRGLSQQWRLEHPAIPPGSRRVRSVTVDYRTDSPDTVREHVIHAICPHAHAEERALARGESIRVTPDRFPWFVVEHAPLSA